MIIMINTNDNDNESNNNTNNINNTCVYIYKYGWNRYFFGGGYMGSLSKNQLNLIRSFAAWKGRR